MTAMPCGQKNSSNAKDHSHTVTPPLAAMVGTTLRLTMATTNNKTRSPGPRTRRKWGAPGAAGVRLTSFANGFLLRLPYPSLVSGRTDKSGASLFLGLAKGRCEFFEYREVFVDIRLGMLHGDGQTPRDRKSTRLNSSHMSISYAVFCLKKKKLRSK